MNPSVSIIVPTFNSEKTIEACLHSIVQQTYPHKEVIVVDNQSTDKTISLLKKYSGQYSYIQFVSEADKGIYDAMNKGIQKASGSYLLFLGSDDALYSETVLEKVFSDPQNGDIDFLYGDVYLKHARKTYSGPSNFEKLVGEQISICHQAIFYRKELFERLGGYNLKYFVHADYDFNVRCFKSPGVKTKYLDTVITLYNEKGFSGLQSNADDFHNDLTMDYITNYARPFDLVLKTQAKQRELDAIKNSGTYKLAKGWQTHS